MARETTLLEICMKRLRILPMAGGTITTKKKLTFMAELANMGFYVDNSERYNDSLLAHYDTILATLRSLKGGNCQYVPLFSGFPNEVPDQNEYFSKRMLGYLRNCLWAFPKGHKLENGWVIPEWLFDIREYGADPISQFQDKGLFRAGALQQFLRKSDTHAEWIKLHIVDENQALDLAREFMLKNLYSRSSIQPEILHDIEYLLGFFGIDSIESDKIIFKETKTIVLKYFWLAGDYASVTQLAQTPTDVLRLFAALTESDISLSTPITFPKFTRAQRRCILSILERAANLREDLRAYKGLWLQVGRYLHPGEYTCAYPQASAAFDELRNGKIRTFNTELESAIAARDLARLVELLSQRPGVFARKIHHVLELFGKNSTAALMAFERVIDSVELKNLLVMDAYFRTIEDSSLRTVINKKGKIRVMRNRRNRIDKRTLAALQELIRTAIVRKIAGSKEDWSGRTVWIDPALKKMTLPLQQRSASEGLLTLGRGTRIPLDMGKVLRLFVYWKENSTRTDLDLSLIQYNADMQLRGHVSYTNLTGMGIIHSGDIQSAPQGAAEFIDVELAAFNKQSDIRYIAIQVNRYCGQTFSDMDCHAGWMIREKVDRNYRSFDIKTVQNKFDLNGTGSYAIPILVDLKTHEIVFIDLYVNALDYHNRAEGAFNDISIISKEMARMNVTRPNLYDLAHFNCQGRKAILSQDKSTSDLTIGVTGSDIDMTNVETVLSAML